ncbi:MAG: PAS domain-containing protein [Thermodesulfobacteriota bacterium]
MTSQERTRTVDYVQLVEQAPIMIRRSNTRAACDFVNHRWLAFTGRSLEQELGDGWTAGIHAEDAEACLAICQAASAHQEPFEMEYRLRRYDGVYCWVLDRGVPFSNGAGRFAGHITSSMEVSLQLETRDHEIRRLQHLLPICPSCQKIRDDRVYWHEVERYLRERLGEHSAAGLCPDCQKKGSPATSG